MRRRFVSWLLNALAVVSLPLCVAATTFWVRSYLANYEARRLFSSLDLRWHLDAIHGVLSVSYDQNPGIHHFGVWYTTTTWQFSRVEFRRTTRASSGDDWWTLQVPCSYLLTVTAPFPAIALLAEQSRRRRARSRSNRCPSCAYDLTGNVSGVCPECGTAVPNPTAGIPT